MAGQCISDPQAPNCLYAGGVCEERTQRCRMPAVMRAYYDSIRATAPPAEHGDPGTLTSASARQFRVSVARKADRNFRLGTLDNNATNTSNTTAAPTGEAVSLTAINQTAAAIILAFFAVLTLAAIVIFLIRTRGSSSRNRYSSV